MSDTKHPYRVLFVEDEKPIRDNYVDYLNLYFDEVYEAEDGEEAYSIYKQKRPHILILDINIPKLSGMDLLKKIRQTDHATKVIMLTAHENVDLLQEAVSLKLTKYLVKPVSRKNLIETLALAMQELSQYTVVSHKKILLKENYSWDIHSEELFCGETLIALTNKEKSLFKVFMSNPKKTFTADEIIFATWDSYDEGNADALKTLIKALRKKLPSDTIKNIFGVGYKIVLS